MRPIEIKENQDPSIYKEALKHGNQIIRAELANKGYFLDELINDFYLYVRIAVIKRDHSYVKYRKKQGLIVDEWNALYDTLKSVANPDPEVVQMLLDAPFKKVFSKPEDEQYHYKYMDALRLKLKAISKEPNPIEKTMSDVQLFEADSPLWATDLTVAQIHDVLEAHEELKQQGYSDFMEYLLTTVREPNYNIHYIGQQESALTFYYKLFYSL